MKEQMIAKMIEIDIAIDRINVGTKITKIRGIFKELMDLIANSNQFFKIKEIKAEIIENIQNRTLDLEVPHHPVQGQREAEPETIKNLDMTLEMKEGHIKEKMILKRDKMGK